MVSGKAVGETSGIPGCPRETGLQQKEQSTSAPVRGASELPLECCAVDSFTNACGTLIQTTWMIKGHGELIFWKNLGGLA